MVHDSKDLAVGRYADKFGRVLLVGAQIEHLQLISELEPFERDRDLLTIGRLGRIERDHGVPSVKRLATPSGRECSATRRSIHQSRLPASLPIVHFCTLIKIPAGRADLVGRCSRGKSKAIASAPRSRSFNT